MPNWDILQGLGLALGLGLLVGLQRQRSASSVAGVRTFALITLAGALSALAANEVGFTSGVWIIAATLLGVIAMTVLSNVMRKPADVSPGITTEIAVLVMFIVGVVCAVGPRAIAVVASGIVFVLLQFKAPMHKFIASLGREDLTGIAQFVLVSLVIYPVLPDASFGPNEVLNLRVIWWMVMLVTGISLTGYFIYKLAGQKAGALVSGILGGVISSTATTLAHSRLARKSGRPEAACAVIMVACTVLYVRLLVLIGVTGPSFFKSAAPPIAIIGAVAIALSVTAWLRMGKKRDMMPLQRNPAQLLPALGFAAAFAVVMLAAAYAKDHYGSAGLYTTAMVGGLTDMDALTLSTTQLVTGGTLSATDGWRTIVVGSLANTLAKGGIAAVVAGWPLFRSLGLLFAVLMAASVVVLVVWPGGEIATAVP